MFVVVILCRNHLFGFDGAKVRRFLFPDKFLNELCAQTVISLTKVNYSAFI